jgi:quercetin dioxygenase-like cupin family protein
MKITPAKTIVSRRMPAEWITGTAWNDELMKLTGEGAIRFVRVSFEPGARTFWHTHPRGQILHIVAGVCRVQFWGEPIVDVSTGDTVHIPADTKHWHGATPTGVMVHLAIQQSDGEKDIEWLEHVTDEQYTRG